MSTRVMSYKNHLMAVRKKIKNLSMLIDEHARDAASARSDRALDQYIGDIRHCDETLGSLISDLADRA